MIPIAVQLYSLREEMQKDALDTIRKVAQIGYKGVEPAGLYGMRPAEFRRVVEDLGMVVCSSHGTYPGEDNFAQCVEAAKALGTNIVVHGGLPGKLTTVAQVKEVADRTNPMIARLAKESISVAMHNHDHEFSMMVEGRRAFDVFMEMCPALGTQMDVFWTGVGGADAVEYVRKYRARLPLMHVKDGPMDRCKPMQTLGMGKLNIPGCVAAADPKVLRWLIVELDSVDGNMTQAIADSYTYMVSKGLAAGNR